MLYRDTNGLLYTMQDDKFYLVMWKNGSIAVSDKAESKVPNLIGVVPYELAEQFLSTVAPVEEAPVEEKAPAKRGRRKAEA